MQMTIYFAEDDLYLIKRAEQEATATRHSLSAIVMTALESYLLENERLGEILVGLGCLKRADLNRALEVQKKRPGELLGAILMELKMVTPADLRLALAIQKEKTPA